MLPKAGRILLLDTMACRCSTPGHRCGTPGHRAVELQPSKATTYDSGSAHLQLQRDLRCRDRHGWYHREHQPGPQLHCQPLQQRRPPWRRLGSPRCFWRLLLLLLRLLLFLLLLLPLLMHSSFMKSPHRLLRRSQGWRRGAQHQHHPQHVQGQARLEAECCLPCVAQQL